MRAIFLSDAHLKSGEDRGYQYIVRFLDTLKGGIDCLFVVGDFFDFWFCRDGKVYPGFSPVIEKLAELKHQGSTIYFCEGNHDFYLEDYLTKVLGISVFTEWADIDLDGRRILVAHGDTVDRENKKYLFLRKLLRSGFIARVQGIVPLALLWGIARASSAMSKELSVESKYLIAGKMEAFALKRLHDDFDAVIFGHCHVPLLKEFDIRGRMKTFVTLGDWIRHFSYLLYEDNRFTLCYFKP